MLGLRRYRQIQIDIWQGDIAKFSVDLASDVSATTWSAQFEGLRKRIAPGGKFHVSFLVASESLAVSALQSVKKLLDEIPSEMLRRITFVAPNNSIYGALQESLFSTFEDELS